MRRVGAGVVGNHLDLLLIARDPGGHTICAMDSCLCQPRNPRRSQELLKEPTRLVHNLDRFWVEARGRAKPDRCAWIARLALKGCCLLTYDLGGDFDGKIMGASTPRDGEQTIRPKGFGDGMAREVRVADGLLGFEGSHQARDMGALDPTTWWPGGCVFVRTCQIATPTRLIHPPGWGGQPPFF